MLGCSNPNPEWEGSRSRSGTGRSLTPHMVALGEPNISYYSWLILPLTQLATLTSPVGKDHGRKDRDPSLNS